jgi:hypothetical protein
MDSPPAKSKNTRAIITAWLVVGILDISSAIVIWWTRGVSLTRGLQGISAGLLGGAAADGGIATAALGLAIHFFVAFVVVTVFYFASRKILFLTQHAVTSGIVYGIDVYLVMYWIVLPTTFATFHHRLFNDALAITIHITLIGLPTALIVRRYST